MMTARFSFLRRGRLLAGAVALALVAGACDFEVGTATGELDPAFAGGDGGSVFGGLRIRTNDTVMSAARLPDGRVVALGVVDSGFPVATRYQPDGTLDRTFGGDGVATVAVDAMGDVAVAPDGAVLVPGRWQQDVWGVARLLPDGTPDPAFGVDGVAVFDVAGASGQNWTLGVATAGDRTYLLAWARHGTGGTIDTVVLGLGPDGSLDPAFGPDGTGILHISGGGDSGAIGIAPDGAAVVSYASRDGSQATVAGVLRISPTGDILARLDLATAATPTPLRSVEDMDVGEDGSVVLTVSDLFGTPTRYVVRVTPALALDPSFGSGGAATLAGLELENTDLVLDDTGGRVIVAGRDRPTGDFVTAALDAGGSLDAGWGDGGIATHAEFPTVTNAGGVFTTPRGVVVAGDTRPVFSDPGDQYLLALTPAGDADPAFGDDGWARVDIGKESSEAFTAVAALPGGELLVAGDTGDGVIAGRYDAGGAPDTDHPPAVLLPERLRGAHNVIDVAAAGDGSAFVLLRTGAGRLDELGGGPFDWKVVKLDADGAVDPSFGDDGVAAGTSSSSVPLSIAVRPDGIVLLAVLDVVPARVIPPRQFVPATFTDRIVSLTPSGATAGTTTLGTTIGFVPSIATGSLGVGPAGDGYVLADGAVRRLAADGTVSAWGSLPAGATLTPSDLAVDGIGRVVVYGSGAPPGGTAGPVVARFDAALVLDTTFGTGGLSPLATPRDAGTFEDRGVLAHADGAVAVVRQMSRQPDPTLLVYRLLPSGRPDPSFSGDGLAEGTLRVEGEEAWVTAFAASGSDVFLAGSVVHAGAFATRVNG
jgi:uncharacterized delta-60 repeat protein